MGKIVFDPTNCTACGACAMACMDQNDIEVTLGERPFRNVYTRETKEGRLHFYSVSCQHCEDAPCIMGCPCGCIYKDEKTGLTLFDTTNCIGCHSCAMACPYGGPTFRLNGKMQKCNGCIGRQEDGRVPACVKICPNGALRVEEKEKRVR